MEDIPLEFEIKKKYKNDFDSIFRKFRLIKVYDNFALYECYKKDKSNKKVPLFNECFSFSYLYNQEYKTDKIE